VGVVKIEQSLVPVFSGSSKKGKFKNLMKIQKILPNRAALAQRGLLKPLLMAEWGWHHSCPP
jgi:hypothetical protein